MSPKKRQRGGNGRRDRSPSPAPPPAQPPPSPPPTASPSLNAVTTSPQDVATQFVPATQDHAPPPASPGAPTEDSIDNVAPTAQTTITLDQPSVPDSSPGDRGRLMMRTFPLLASPQKNLLLQLTLDVSRDPVSLRILHVDLHVAWHCTLHANMLPCPCLPCVCR